MKVTGRCHCGQISFEAEIDPAQVRICHCTDCQTLTGTAFRTTVPSLPSSFVLKSGTPKIYIKTAESGNKRVHAFCAECGTPIYAAAPGANPPSHGLRVGTLDRRAELRPTRQGWCRSAVLWSMDLTGVERFEANNSIEQNPHTNSSAALPRPTVPGASADTGCRSRPRPPAG